MVNASIAGSGVGTHGGSVDIYRGRMPQKDHSRRQRDTKVAAAKASSNIG